MSTKFYTLEDCEKHLADGVTNGWPDTLPGNMARDLISTSRALQDVNDELRQALYGSTGSPQIITDAEIDKLFGGDLQLELDFGTAGPTKKP